MSRSARSISPNGKLGIAKPLLRWFDRHQRSLPWRLDKSAYQIWVSEIMLQQTQVKTVVPYFERFLAKFPTIQKLASAEESAVLKLWEGLGYYRRARQLHEAAKLIVERHQGEFPTDYNEVLDLPGIGRYTAGAILSIALDHRLPILEGNTMRVYSRLLALRTDPRLPTNQKFLWQFAESILPKKRAGDFNQALMELGSETCTPKSPSCDQCPVLKHCASFAEGLQEKLPAAGKKMNYESIEEAAVIIKRRGKFLVRLCQPGERWASLWDFPRFRLDNPKAFDPCKTNSPEHAFILKHLENEIKRKSGLEVRLKSNNWRLRHVVTRFRITLYGFEATQANGQLKASRKASRKAQSPPQFRWVSLEELHGLPMSATGRNLVTKIQESGF